MVHRANKEFDGLGGHISTYASSATLYEIGFNHFFRGKTATDSGIRFITRPRFAWDVFALVPRGGASRSIGWSTSAARTERGRGLSSYPHPRLMSDYWEFPTVSMGLGPIGAIYQARFNRYMENRGLADTSKSHVWCFVGDGETDEPETLGALRIAAGESSTT